MSDTLKFNSLSIIEFSDFRFDNSIVKFKVLVLFRIGPSEAEIQNKYLEIILSNSKGFIFKSKGLNTSLNDLYYYKIDTNDKLQAERTFGLDKNNGNYFLDVHSSLFDLVVLFDEVIFPPNLSDDDFMGNYSI